MATLSAPSDVFISRASAAYGASDWPRRNTFNRSKCSGRPCCTNSFRNLSTTLVEHRKRPAPLEDPLRRLIVRRLSLVALFPEGEFERDNRSAAPFMRALAIFFVS